jgi:hypothetical protein
MQGGAEKLDACAQGSGISPVRHHSRVAVAERRLRDSAVVQKLLPARNPAEEQDESGRADQAPVRAAAPTISASVGLAPGVEEKYAGPPDDVRRYLTALPAAAAQYFGPSLELCARNPIGAGLVWTSTSTVTFESGRSGTLAVATVIVAKYPGFVRKVFGLSRAPDCVGFDKVPVDSLYVSYVDPDGYRWSFAVPLQRKK